MSPSGELHLSVKFQSCKAAVKDGIVCIKSQESQGMNAIFMGMNAIFNRLYGNPVCGNANERQITQFCKSKDGDEMNGSLNNSISSCAAQQPCNNYFEHVPALMDDFCAAPSELVTLKKP
ncbi:hypothetical protein HAX54_023108 [Datura stramonium]|uniref:Uncharacterized protein n=1 Tax=Datura stramonium TaxID=4076 RepID=A0ABS8RJT6_DATST|nr:hypothetical protein [Datura stramonium]